MSTVVDIIGDPVALIAEDHPTTLKLMSTWLEMSGYKVAQATDGDEAWYIAQTKCPPIVVTDWSMPGMSGVELCRSIRTIYPRHEVFVLIATARDGSEDIAVAMDAGANDFVAKPISEQEFLARIRSAEFSLKELRSQAELVETDPLTGLFNRRFFDVQCQHQIQRAVEYGLPLSCISLDIDHFKHINDCFGHAVGDKVLVEVADLLRQETRQSDLVCRRGGDEFCVLLAQSSEERATEVAQRIRCQLAQHSIAIENKPGEEVHAQVSIGVAGCTSEIRSAEQLIDLADQVLLKAKASGRNRVLCREELVQGEGALCDQPIPKVQLQGVVAKDIMTIPAVVLSENHLLKDAHRLFMMESVDCAPVVDSCRRLVGIISERDLLHALATGADMKTSVCNFMSSNVARFHEQTPVEQIWECLQRSPMLRVMIVKDDTPTGVVSRSALLGLYHID